MSRGQDLYSRAKRIIPGGTQLLSKRPEMFLPNKWPSYYSSAKGCKIWDLDNNEYYDVCYMGIGANTLGYANDEVDEAAISAIRNGGMCTLNAPEEVYLSEELLKIHKWAKCVRYAKTGGEAMSIAVRIARAHTQKDIVLFCGYHGWHDWYLAANINNNSALNGHHISGLEPSGVPKSLMGTAYPFLFNNVEELEALAKKYDNKIAAIIMEPIRNNPPTDDFMKSVFSVAREKDIVVIFDEITAGFRYCTGGSHLYLGYTPDICVLGKGMTNGYPLTAVLGKREIMDSAQETFISSTYFTERIAFAATLKAVEVYQREKVFVHQVKQGKKVKHIWKSLAEKYNISINVSGMDPLPHFDFVEKPMINKTFFTQEMMKKGFLASNAFYVSYAHDDEVIELYYRAIAEVFKSISEIVQNNGEVEKFLEGPICQSGFQRLN